MARLGPWLGQALFYALFAAIIGIFSAYPPYRHLPPDHALIRLSFSHTGQLISECRQRTPEELARLPANMRAPMECQRERSPVTVEVDIDGRRAYRHVAIPAGLARDGASTAYERFEVAAGQHRLAVRFSDDAKAPGFPYRREETVTLRPGQVLVIDFDSARGGILMQ